MNNALETAANPQSLRRVAIDPVSRVEGHGKVTLLLDENNKVHQVRLHIVEFRGFEKFIQGRPYWEVPVMVQRLCGICPVSHHLAASKAMDLIVGATAVTPTAEKIRRLMHYGQMLQSHALHFFHLASPDLLFGFSSDLGKRNIIGIAEKHPQTARMGILLRKFGQEVIRVTAGKRIHGTGSLPGGVNKSLTPADRSMLLADIDQIIGWCEQAVQMARQIHDSDAVFYDAFGHCPSSLMSIIGTDVQGHGALDFYHGSLRARDASGQLLFDSIDYQRYGDHIGEAVKNWTYMKFPFFRHLGTEAGWYKVGPLARIQNCDRIPSILAEKERRQFIRYAGGAPLHGPLAYHWARMIEMLHAAEIIRDLLLDEDIVGTDLIVRGERGHEGVGVIEAPRGTLFHHYQVDENDLVTMCNLIVSTTSNNQAMNESVRQVARQYLDGKEITEGLLNHIEVAIRAFDPCLSCATHAMGKMPLLVELVDAEGHLVHQLSRND